MPRGEGDTHATMVSGEAVPPPVQNRLLAAVPPAEFAVVARSLEPVQLGLRQVLFLPGEPIEAVYFPVSGLVSAFTDTFQGGHGLAVEVAAIGRDGMLGLGLLPDANCLPFRALCQIPGAAYRAPLPAFCELADSLPGFRSLLWRYTQFAFGRLAHVSACNLLHPVERRCARRLLDVHDQVGERSFRLTHEFLAEMLGARRSTVTAAVRRLADRGLLEYRWGRMTILDRAGLEAAGCACYRRIRDEYERLLLR